MKNQYPTFSMDAVRGADLIQRHKAGLSFTQTSMIYMPQQNQTIYYCKISNIRHTKFPNLNVSRLVL